MKEKIDRPVITVIQNEIAKYGEGDKVSEWLKLKMQIRTEWFYRNSLMIT